MPDTSTTTVLEPPTIPEPATAGPASTLADLPAPDSPHLVLLTDTGTPAVVLAHHRDRVELLYADATTVTVPAHTPAATITDLHQQTALLRTAVAHLRSRLLDAKTSNTTADVRRDRVLAEIRDYAVEQHEAGAICRNGLDRFLAEFDLDPYLPPLRVRFTITGSYVVHNSTRGHAEDDGINLRVDYSSIDDIQDGSGEIDVIMDDITEVDD